MSQQHTQVITDGLAAGQSKATILTSLIRTDPDLDLVTAGTLYKKVGTAEGWLLSNEDKAALVTTIIEQYTTVDKKAKTKTLDREKAIAALVERAHISAAAATGRLKEQCAEQGITLPAAQRGRDMEAVHAAFKAWWDDEKVDEAAIKAGMIQHFKYTEKNVDANYGKIGRELGLIAGAVRSNVGAVVDWFVTGNNAEGDKKAVTERMVADGVTASTADYRWKLLEFGKEYHARMTQGAEPAEK